MGKSAQNTKATKARPSGDKSNKSDSSCGEFLNSPHTGTNTSPNGCLPDTNPQEDKAKEILSRFRQKAYSFIGNTDNDISINSGNGHKTDVVRGNQSTSPKARYTPELYNSNMNQDREECPPPDPNLPGPSGLGRQPPSGEPSPEYDPWAKFRGYMVGPAFNDDLEERVAKYYISLGAARLLPKECFCREPPPEGAKYDHWYYCPLHPENLKPLPNRSPVPLPPEEEFGTFDCVPDEICTWDVKKRERFWNEYYRRREANARAKAEAIAEAEAEEEEARARFLKKRQEQAESEAIDKVEAAIKAQINRRRHDSFEEDDYWNMLFHDKCCWNYALHNYSPVNKPCHKYSPRYREMRENMGYVGGKDKPCIHRRRILDESCLKCDIEFNKHKDYEGYMEFMRPPRMRERCATLTSPNAGMIKTSKPSTEEPKDKDTCAQANESLKKTKEDDEPCVEDKNQSGEQGSHWMNRFRTIPKKCWRIDGHDKCCPFGKAQRKPEKQQCPEDRPGSTFKGLRVLGSSPPDKSDGDCGQYGRRQPEACKEEPQPGPSRLAVPYQSPVVDEKYFQTTISPPDDFNLGMDSGLANCYTKYGLSLMWPDSPTDKRANMPTQGCPGDGNFYAQLIANRRFPEHPRPRTILDDSDDRPVTMQKAYWVPGRAPQAVERDPNFCNPQYVSQNNRARRRFPLMSTPKPECQHSTSVIDPKYFRKDYVSPDSSPTWMSLRRDVSSRVHSKSRPGPSKSSPETCLEGGSSIPPSFRRSAQQGCVQAVPCPPAIPKAGAVMQGKPPLQRRDGTYVVENAKNRQAQGMGPQPCPTGRPVIPRAGPGMQECRPNSLKRQPPQGETMGISDLYDSYKKFPRTGDRTEVEAPFFDHGTMNRGFLNQSQTTDGSYGGSFADKCQKYGSMPRPRPQDAREAAAEENFRKLFESNRGRVSESLGFDEQHFDAGSLNEAFLMQQSPMTDDTSFDAKCVFDNAKGVSNRERMSGQRYRVPQLNYDDHNYARPCRPPQFHLEEHNYARPSRPPQFHLEEHNYARPSRPPQFNLEEHNYARPARMQNLYQGGGLRCPDGQPGPSGMMSQPQKMERSRNAADDSDAGNCLNESSIIRRFGMNPKQNVFQSTPVKADNMVVYPSFDISPVDSVCRDPQMSGAHNYLASPGQNGVDDWDSDIMDSPPDCRNGDLRAMNENIPLDRDCDQDEDVQPRKYCIFYMTETGGSAFKNGKDVEVLIEELTEKKKVKETKSETGKEKTNKLTEVRSDSMALKHQKGVSKQAQKTKK